MWSSQVRCPILVLQLLLLFFLSASGASGVTCLMDAVHKSNVVSISSNGTVLKDKFNATVPSKIGSGCWWGCGTRDGHGQGRRGRGGGRGGHRPSYSPRLYRVGEYARCSGRNRCRGVRLLCPMHCNGPCFYDCESNCRAHCRL